jgi:hypothetical protein
MNTRTAIPEKEVRELKVPVKGVAISISTLEILLLKSLER